VIPVTDEMRRAFDGAISKGSHVELEDDALDACLTAVLAIVERQWQEQYGDAFQAGWWRGQHELCPRCGVELAREVREQAGEVA
jgi:hypothetical protein